MQRDIKLHFVKNFSEGDSDGQFKAISKVFKLVGLQECDVIYCSSIQNVNDALIAKEVSGKPLVTYCWDYYKWVHEGKNVSFPWEKYRELLRNSELILVPSDGQKKRLKELLNLDSVVCECSIEFYKHETLDGHYVLDPVRDYPEENLGWVKRACEEIGIPYLHTEHSYSQEEFRKLVNECTFMTCAYREASTGGLSLMEGLYNGKVSLVSDSPYMGASNYLKDLGFYFKHDSYESLKDCIKLLWQTKPTIPKEKAREHCQYFTHDTFASRLKENILCVLNKN